MDNYAVFEAFSDYERIRGRLLCRLLNGQNAETRYGDMPSRPWMDLRLCCYCDLTEEGMPDASLTVRDYMLPIWHVDAETVLADAWENTESKKEVLFCRLDRYLRRLCKEAGMTGPAPFPDGPPLYILSNTERIYGAVHMAFPDVLRRIGEQLERDFYILPSSIHECLILPYSDMICEDELNDMVSVINFEQVAGQDILADHVYFYERSKERVRMCLS